MTMRVSAAQLTSLRSRYGWRATAKRPARDPLRASSARCPQPHDSGITPGLHSEQAPAGSVGSIGSRCTLAYRPRCSSWYSGRRRGFCPACCRPHILCETCCRTPGNVGQPSLRLPRAADLTPPALAIGLLDEAGQNARFSVIAPLRVAGKSAAGLQLTPADPASTIARIDMWAVLYLAGERPLRISGGARGEYPRGTPAPGATRVGRRSATWSRRVDGRPAPQASCGPGGGGLSGKRIDVVRNQYGVAAGPGPGNGPAGGGK